MKKSTVAAAFCAAGLLTGCVSYTGITESSDELVDESNQAYAAEAQKAYVARMNAPARPVVISEAPEMNVFLGPKSFGGHPLCNDIEIRKEVAIAFKSQLRGKVGGIKDFKLMDEVQPMVAVGDAATPPPVYRITYNVTSLELKENAAGSMAMGLAGNVLGGGSGAVVANQKFWEGVAKVEVRLFQPDGVTQVFAFVGEGLHRKMIDANGILDKTFLVEAVKNAADNAMDGYVRKFGPPTFVSDTCQGGQFAKLSIGSKFGVQAGQKVEFYRNKVRKGVGGAEEAGQMVVGTGIVGADGAPVEENGAWARVENFDPQKRTVFRWTSARIVPAAK